MKFILVGRVYKKLQVKVNNKRGPFKKLRNVGLFRS